MLVTVAGRQYELTLVAVHDRKVDVDIVRGTNQVKVTVCADEIRDLFSERAHLWLVYLILLANWMNFVPEFRENIWDLAEALAFDDGSVPFLFPSGFEIEGYDIHYSEDSHVYTDEEAKEML